MVVAGVTKGTGALKSNSWDFCSPEDVERFWAAARTVPLGAEGRKHHHEEEYAAGLYLLLLGRHGLLNYPLRVRGELQFRPQSGSEISRDSVVASDMTQGLRPDVEVHHFFQPA